MSDGYKKIILVTDTSKNSRAAGQTALDLAKQHSAKLLIVDVARAPSLMSKLLSGSFEDLFEIVVNEKQERLDKFARTFHEAGIEVETRLLVGNSSEQIARTAIMEDADLVVRYMKGVNSRTSSPFGTTARNLMRVCPIPLLLVGDKPVASPNVLACVNAEHGANENKAILSEAKRLAGESENLKAMYCWKFYGGEYLGQYMNEETVKHYMDDAEQNYRGICDQFLKDNDLSAYNNHLHMENGDPIDLIPEVCRRESIDVAVMSSASQNHPLHRLLGSTVESILEVMPCSLLVVKPLGFKSPVKVAEHIEAE